MATTTNYSWTTPDNTAYVKDGASAIRTLGSSVDTTLFTALGGTYPGLRLVKKQTIGSGVSSINITSAFSATYQNYKILVSGGASSVNGVSLTVALDGITSGYYSNLTYAGWGSGSTSPTVARANSNSSMPWCGSGNTTGLKLNLDLSNPFLSTHKTGTGFLTEENVSGNTGPFTHWVNTSSSVTGFTIAAAGGTITGGTVYVYGYGIS